LWSRRSATVSSRDRYGRETGMDNDLVKRLVWSGMLTASSALASLLAARAAALLWRRLFDEDPPD